MQFWQIQHMSLCITIQKKEHLNKGQNNKIANVAGSIFMVWLLSRDRLFTRIIIFNIVGVKCCEAAIKYRPEFICVVIFFSGPSRTMTPYI